MSSLIPETSARKHIHVVCMVKKTPKILYEYPGKQYTVEGIYRLLKKRPGRELYVIVFMNKCT